jgi:hypothetical protein
MREPGFRIEIRVLQNVVNVHTSGEPVIQPKVNHLPQPLLTEHKQVPQRSDLAGSEPFSDLIGDSVPWHLRSSTN